MSGIYLKQSTASQSRAIGPFIDDTDFKTTEPALTIANTDIKLVVNGGASANKNSGGGTHRVNGVYGVTFDATDTATVGEMQVSVVVAGALPVFHTFYVLEEAVYDAQFAASSLGYVANAPVNVAQISGDSVAADNLETAFDDTAGAVGWTGIIDQGTAQSATSSTLVLRAAAAFANDELNGAAIMITGGTTGVGQVRIISGYVLATDTATVSPPWTTTPSGTITYKILAAPPAPTVAAALPAVNVTHFGGTAGTFASGIPEAKAASLATQAQTDVRTAAGLAAANLDTQLSTIDTVVDAVKVKTDFLPSATAGAAGGVFIAGSNAATSITTALTADITGSLSGSVGSVSGAVGSVTGAVGSVAAGGITAASIATGAIDADALAADAVDEILDEVVEGSTTLRQMLRGFASALLAKASGLATTTAVYRDVGDTKDRITATVDADGNRSAVTLDLT